MCYFRAQSTWDRVSYFRLIFLHRGEPFIVTATFRAAIVGPRLEKLDWDEFYTKAQFSVKSDTEFALFLDTQSSILAAKWILFSRILIRVKLCSYIYSGCCLHGRGTENWHRRSSLFTEQLCKAFLAYCPYLKLIRISETMKQPTSWQRVSRIKCRHSAILRFGIMRVTISSRGSPNLSIF